MDILFRKVFNSLVLNKIIFKYVHYIFVDNLKLNFTFKWNEVLKSRYLLAGNGYLNHLKEYYQINNSEDLKFDRKETVLLNAFKSKSLDIIKFIIEELHYDINLYGCFSQYKDFHFKDKDLLYIASMYRDIEIIKYIDSLKNNDNSENSKWDYIESFIIAPLSHNIGILQYLHNRLIENNQILNNSQIKKLFFNSFSIGRMDIVEWLMGQPKYSINLKEIENMDDNIVLKVAKGGYMDTIKWLDYNNIGIFNKEVMNLSSWYGHLEMVKWLHQNRTEGCTTSAMDNAAQNGHFEIVKWLHHNRTEGCTTDAMIYAANYGHLEIIKYLHDNRIEGCTTDAIDNAAKNGYLEIIKWLHHNRTEGCTTNAMDRAAKNGYLEIIKWLHHNRTEGCTASAMDHAAWRGHFEIVKWLHYNRTECCTNYAMDSAAWKGHFEIVKWLHYNRTEGCTTMAMNNATKNGHLEIVKWLLDNRTEGCTYEAIQFAEKKGYTEIIEFLRKKVSKWS